MVYLLLQSCSISKSFPCLPESWSTCTQPVLTINWESPQEVSTWNSSLWSPWGGVQGCIMSSCLSLCNKMPPKCLHWWFSGRILACQNAPKFCSIKQQTHILSPASEGRKPGSSLSERLWYLTGLWLPGRARDMWNLTEAGGSSSKTTNSQDCSRMLPQGCLSILTTWHWLSLEGGILERGRERWGKPPCL